MHSNTKKILAIDPGFERVGIAVLEKSQTNEACVHSECFKTSTKLPFEERLRLIGEHILGIIKKFKPSALVLETLFLTTNHKTVMHVAEARGVITYIGASQGLSLFEYSPPQIKVALTGHGKADKQQVDIMVRRILKMSMQEKIIDDEMDAIALGLTHFAHTGHTL